MPRPLPITTKTQTCRSLNQSKDICQAETFYSGTKWRTVAEMRGLLLLLSALVLLESTEGNLTYEQLVQHDKEIVDKAIKKANAEFKTNSHLDFSDILNADKRSHMLHVLLKPTSCNKMKDSVHNEGCTIRNNAKPFISCVACSEEISCQRFMEKQKIEQSINMCLSNGGTHHTGSTHLLFQRGQEEQEIGCVGCI